MSRVEVITIQNKNGMTATVATLGATLMALHVPNNEGKKVNVVVGLQEGENYIQEPYLSTGLYLGASVGRYAGRISGGQFTIDGNTYPVAHSNGVHLHGGKKGLSQQFWKVKEQAENKVVLSCTSPDLEEGYPGNLNVEVAYEITESNSLKVTYTANTDAPTVLNLTNHAYFNLDGEGSILNHELQINSDFILEADDRRVPSGKLLDVSETYFDARKPVTIGRSDFKGYDDAFVLQKESHLKASLASAKTKLRMNVYTNQPATVVYTPKEFAALPFLDAANYEKFPAICFETQNFPDAPNHSNFPSAVLRPGAVYVNESVFEFVAL